MPSPQIHTWSHEEILTSHAMRSLTEAVSPVGFYADPKNWESGAANDGGLAARTAMRNVATLTEPIERRVVRYLVARGPMRLAKIEALPIKESGLEGSKVPPRKGVSRTRAVLEWLESQGQVVRGGDAYAVSDASRAEAFLEDGLAPKF